MFFFKQRKLFIHSINILQNYANLHPTLPRNYKDLYNIKTGQIVIITEDREKDNINTISFGVFN